MKIIIRSMCLIIIATVLSGCSKGDYDDETPIETKPQRPDSIRCVSWEKECVPVLARFLSFPEQYEGMTIRYDGYITFGKQIEIFPDPISACNMLHGLSFELFDLMVGDDFMARITHFGVVRATVTGRLHVPVDGSRSSLGQLFVRRAELHNEEIDTPVLANGVEIIKPANKTSCDDKAGQERSISPDDRGMID